jgi:myo-inositol-1(or 4)-monophosphatase
MVKRASPTKSVTPASLRSAALDAAKNAGKILLNGLKKEIGVRYKGEINIVTDVDHRAEELIVRTILKRFPDHNILAEEGHRVDGGSPYRWIIDPLDGTTNYAHRFPFFCVSLGLEWEGEILLGVVYDPVRSELFYAERNRGARLNGKPIHVSSKSPLASALLVTGFAYDVRISAENNIDHFVRFSKRAQGVRRTGSAALDLCYVASGRFDGFWEMKLNPWDVAAGSLLVREAGGEVSGFSGGPFNVDSKEILATNGKIHKEMVSTLKGSDSPI